MPASVEIYEMAGASVGTDKTSSTVRFKSADEVAIDYNNRLRVPVAGNTSYSYTKQLRFHISVVPSVDIQNLKAYTDGINDFGTGKNVQYDVLDNFITNTNANIAGTDLFLKDINSMIDLGAGPYSGVGFIGKFLRMQMVLSSDALPGILNAEQLTFAYDET